MSPAKLVEASAQDAKSGADGGVPLARARLGINQILWANDDLPELTPPIDSLTILDEIARSATRGASWGPHSRGAPHSRRP